jgi:hypothetical protein
VSISLDTEVKRDDEYSPNTDSYVQLIAILGSWLCCEIQAEYRYAKAIAAAQYEHSFERRFPPMHELSLFLTIRMDIIPTSPMPSYAMLGKHQSIRVPVSSH